MKISMIVAAAALGTRLPRQGVAAAETDALICAPQSDGSNRFTPNLGRGAFMFQISQSCFPADPLHVAIPQAGKAEKQSPFASSVEKWQKMGFDDLGKLVPMDTVRLLSRIVAQKKNWRRGEGGELAAFAKKYHLTQTLAIHTHLATIIYLIATEDPNRDLLNIAKMGLMIAMENPETNGMPEGGFEPLYKILEESGYNRDGVLVDQKKYDERARLMEASENEFTEFNKFLDEISFFSLLRQYFTAFPGSKSGDKEAAADRGLGDQSERTTPLLKR